MITIAIMPTIIIAKDNSWGISDKNFQAAGDIVENPSMSSREYSLSGIIRRLLKWY
jgi:hypothetical protein